MTRRGVIVPASLVAFLIFAAIVYFMVRQADAAPTVRCTPAGGCVDNISSPHVMRRPS